MRFATPERLGRFEMATIEPSGVERQRAHLLIHSTGTVQWPNNTQRAYAQVGISLHEASPATVDLNHVFAMTLAWVYATLPSALNLLACGPSIRC